jgi:ELWxxDGT repeat protein
VLEACEPRTLLAVALVKDLNPGSGALGLQSALTPLDNGRIIFAASNASTGGTSTLYGSDGTSGGTVKLSDKVFNAGEFGVTANGAIVTLENVTPGAGRQLYITDGTVAGTKFLLNGDASQFIRVGSKVIFNLASSRDNTWISDGTAAGTKLLATGINIATGSTSATAGGFTFFRGGATATGRELYKTDGVTVSLVKDIIPGGGESSPEQIVALGNKVVFAATDPTTGREMYVSDGTAAGTFLLKDIAPNGVNGAQSSVDQFVAVGNKVVFRAYDGNAVSSYTRELWSTDGTTAGTKKIPKITIDSFQQAVASNGKLLFRGSNYNTSPVDSKLFITDGDAVTPIYSLSGGMDAQYFLSTNGVVYFDESDATSGRELWRSNGTTNGTAKVFDINPGVGSSSPTNFVATGKGVFFIAEDGTHGRELWAVTGPAASAVAVSQGTARPYRTVQLTFNDNLGASITKDDVVLRRRKDKRVVAGSYWKFSTFLDNQNRTVVQARVTKADLQGKYEIVVLKGAVATSQGLANADDIRVKFFLEPVVSGATFGGTPIGGSLLGNDGDGNDVLA